MAELAQHVEATSVPEPQENTADILAPEVFQLRIGEARLLKEREDLGRCRYFWQPQRNLEKVRPVEDEVEVAGTGGHRPAAGDDVRQDNEETLALPGQQVVAVIKLEKFLVDPATVRIAAQDKLMVFHRSAQEECACHQLHSTTAAPLQPATAVNT